jgi:replication-associated recombination protein RarA
MVKTVRGYTVGECISALQKTIRRGDARLAGYFAMELFESGFDAYAWRRLLTISAEDCHACITAEMKALADSAALVKKIRKTPERIFLAKAAIVLALAKKCRDADHMSCLMYDQGMPDDQTVRAAIDDARADIEPIPPYAYDVHTLQGKRAGKTREDFFLDEHDALAPRVPGLFDDDLEALRTEVKRWRQAKNRRSR